jgi:hypothetical protein
MCSEPFVALKFLQSEIFPLIDHTNEKESREFRNLTWSLFGWENRFLMEDGVAFNHQKGFIGGDMQVFVKEKVNDADYLGGGGLLGGPSYSQNKGMKITKIDIFCRTVFSSVAFV